MVNVGFSFFSILGLMLLLFALSLVPLGLRLRQPFNLLNTVQDAILAFVYISCAG